MAGSGFMHRPFSSQLKKKEEKTDAGMLGHSFQGGGLVALAHSAAKIRWGLILYLKKKKRIWWGLDRWQAGKPSQIVSCGGSGKGGHGRKGRGLAAPCDQLDWT